MGELQRQRLFYFWSLWILSEDSAWLVFDRRSLGSRCQIARQKGALWVRGYLLRTTCGLLANEQVMKFRQKLSGDTLYLVRYGLTEKKPDVPLGTQALQAWNRVDKLKAEYRLVLRVRFVILDPKIFPVQKHVVFFPTVSRSCRMTIFLHVFCLAYDLRTSWKNVLFIKYKNCSQANNSGHMFKTFFSMCRCIFHTHHDDYIALHELKENYISS